MEDLQWTDELVTEFARHIRQAFEEPNTYNGGVWEGIQIELAKWKDSKIRKPLFTTEDGVDKYEGDNCWHIDGEMSSKPIMWFSLPKPLRRLDGPNSYRDISRLKYFHSEEKAKEYLLFNRPCLSVKDILSFGGSSDIRGEYAKVYTDELKKFAQSKINN